MLTLQINSDAVERALREARREIGDTLPLLRVLQRRGVNEVREHFLRRNAEGNRKGWPSRNFWSREGYENTGAGTLTPESAVIAVASPAIAHKARGGTIFPQRGRALAIPLTGEAYAAGSPKNWPAQGGRYLFRPAGRRFLAVRERGKGKGALRAMYALVPSVTQAKDPRTLPPEAALRVAFEAEARAWVARNVRRMTA